MRTLLHRLRLKSQSHAWPLWTRQARATPAPRSRARHSAVLLCSLLLGVVLAGCGGGVVANPLVVASVDGQPVSLAAFQRLLTVAEANNAQQGSVGSTSWLTPDGRSSLASLQQQTLDFLTDALVLHEQVRKLRATVNPKDVDAQMQLYSTQFKNVLSSDPNNPTFRQFAAGVAATMKQHPGNNDQAALIAGQPDVGGAFNILALEFAEEVALSSKVKVPQADVSIIIVQNAKQADTLKQQAENGADFAALAKQNSTDTTTAAKGGDISPVYLGKLSQNGPQFDADIFGPTANLSQSPWYIVIPFSGSFVLCKVTNRTSVAVSSLGDSQAQLTAMNTWLALIARPAAHIQQYLAIDATPTTAPPSQSGA